MQNPAEPYALKHENKKEHRQKMLNGLHMKSLKDFVETIRNAHPDKKPESIPDFDPCDGGVNAKVLFVLEAPGPQAVKSGFISRNNPDPTAKKMCEMLQQANIAREDTILWNIVPWYIGNDARTRIRAANSGDKAEGICYLNRLIEQLEQLQIIVLVGKHAQSQKSEIIRPEGVDFFATPHPSARVFNVWKDKETEMKVQLKEIAKLIR